MIMMPLSVLLAQGAGAESSPFASFVPLLLIVAIFYFVVLRPSRVKQRDLEELVKKLTTGDKIVLNSGIFGTVVGVEEKTFQVRIDERTKIRVLKSAVAGPQGQPEAKETEKK